MAGPLRRPWPSLQLPAVCCHEDEVISRGPHANVINQLPAVTRISSGASAEAPTATITTTAATPICLPTYRPTSLPACTGFMLPMCDNLPRWVFTFFLACFSLAFLICLVFVNTSLSLCFKVFLPSQFFCQSFVIFFPSLSLSPLLYLSHCPTIQFLPLPCNFNSKASTIVLNVIILSQVPGVMSLHDFQYFSSFS